VASFYRGLYSCKLREDGEDKLWWAPSHNGVLRLSLSIEPFWHILSLEEHFEIKGSFENSVLCVDGCS
jgi:hypothetical protein